MWETLWNNERGIVEINKENSRQRRLHRSIRRRFRQVTIDRFVEFEHIERSGGDEFGLYHPNFVLVGKASTGDLMLSDGNTFNALVNLQAGVEIQNPNNLQWQDANFKMDGPRSNNIDELSREARYSWGYTSVGRRSNDLFSIDLVQNGISKPKFNLSYTNNTADSVVARFWIRLTPVRTVVSLRYLKNKRLNGKTSGGLGPIRSDNAICGLHWNFGNFKGASFNWFDFFERDLVDPDQQILAPLDNPQAPSTIFTLPLVVASGSTITVDPSYTESAPGWSVDVEDNGEWSDYFEDSSEWIGDAGGAGIYRIVTKFDIDNTDGFDSGDSVDSLEINNWNNSDINGSPNSGSAGPYDGDGVGSEPPDDSDGGGSTDTTTQELLTRCDNSGREYVTGISLQADISGVTLGATANSHCEAARTGAASDYFAIAWNGDEDQGGGDNHAEYDEYDEAGAPDLVITWTEPAATSIFMTGMRGVQQPL